MDKALPPPLDVHGFETSRHEHPPGSRASTVHAHTWWKSSFRLLKRFGGTFSEFIRSFHRKSAISRDEDTAALWPMPLPFPGALTSSDSSSDVALKRGVNLVIAGLNWLHLRRPRTCPEEIVLFRKLSRLQWRVVRFVEGAMAAWSESEPITSSSMGRAASKVEDIELLLSRLSNFEAGVGSVMDEILPLGSDNPSASKHCSSFSPGLQAESAGELIGHLAGQQLSVAKSIEADRIDFRGRPDFDASPYLDPVGRALYLDPVGQSLKPDEVLEDPPVVKIFATEKEKWKLLKKLDSTGRLSVIEEGKVYPGYQAGLFAVQKDGEKDRLIFDSRPWNTLEKVPRRWIHSMGSASSLCELYMDSGQMILTSGTDLREFYYSFQASESRLIRNSLLITVWPWELRGFQCYHPRLEKLTGKLYLGLRTLAMGDSAAVELAQTAHVGLLSQMGLLDFTNLVSMQLPPPRSLSMIGVVIDDLILFEKVAMASYDMEKASMTEPMLQMALERYTEAGLIPHPGKTFALKENQEFWGCLFEGRRGFVRASLKRVVPILFATLGILKLGVTTLKLLEVLTGCWVSIFLFKRRMLSLLNACYEALSRGEDRRAVLRISESLRDELLLCCMLAPVAVTSLRAEASEFLYASDASDWGFAVVKAPLTGWMKNEIHRHRLRKNTWVRLLSPLKARARLREELAVEEELPDGKVLATHPLWTTLAGCLQFEVVVKQKTRDGAHINLGELKGMVAAEREAVRDKFPVRCFDLADSQVALGVWVKGRSSSRGLNQILQQSLAVHCGCGVTANGGYLPSALNPSDDPTRHVRIRTPVLEMPGWFPGQDPLAEESDELARFDAWLKSLQADPVQLSGLPPFSELYPAVEEDYLWTHRSKILELRRRARETKNSKLQQGGGADSTERKNDPRVDTTPKLPSAESLGRRRLSASAMTVLQKVPRPQFMFPRNWKVPSEWVPDFPGYLDLYSGVKGIAKVVVAMGSLWAITFELLDGEEQDILLPENVALIESLIATRCVDCMGAAIFCCSFSRAVRPPVRSAMQPDGWDNLSQNMQKKVDMGNAHSRLLQRFVVKCQKQGIFVWVENPDGSFLWLQIHWRDIGANDYNNCLRLDYCVYGTAWRKRTRFYTDLHIAGQRTFCDRSHSHRRLVGWSRAHGCSWTKAAQAYPKRLCRWIAQTILIDIGVFPKRRRVDVAALAKLTPGRIGEAANPGPRQNRRPRVQGQLHTVGLVEPATELLGIKSWEAFKRWCLRSLSPEAFNSLSSCHPALGELLEQFGYYMFDAGLSIYLYRQLLTFVQRRAPQARHHLGKAWQVIIRWEAVEPTHHRTPLPLAIYRAMVATALGLGWLRWAGIVVLAFEGITRPGEALHAIRSDLLLPRDLIFESDDSVYLQIRSPKGRRRGIGAVQHSKITGLAIAKMLDRAYGNLRGSEQLYPAAPSTFRKRWDHILRLLHIPVSVGFTPASLRAGGAVSAYRQNEDLGRLMWRMRIRQAETLQHYIQEVAAVSIFGELPQISQRRILAAGSMYSFYLDLS